jgi:hypothetical protein
MTDLSKLPYEIAGRLTPFPRVIVVACLLELKIDKSLEKQTMPNERGGKLHGLIFYRLLVSSFL